ncbi:MAG TPA: ribosomal-processing cysteine protease Prp [bacterium]|nr:ribosomal-processing cysteine protease Prp [bacterium]HPN32174.1 ribosomal-processing cysteine protease Prp [bacterium]
MIKAAVINRKIENGLSAIKVEGHSKVSELCNAVSILMKTMESGVESAADILKKNDARDSYWNNEISFRLKNGDGGTIYRINKPCEGIFEIYFENTEYTDFLIAVFKKTANWLINQYPEEITFYEVK